MSLRSAWSSASPPLLLTTERAMRIPLHVPKSHGLRRLNCMLVLVADPGKDEDPDDELAENGIPEKKKRSKAFAEQSALATPHEQPGV